MADPSETPLFATVLPWRAIPKGRPRVARKGHCYTPVRTREFEAQIRRHLAAKAPQLCHDALRAEIRFYFKKPKSGKLSYPPGDVDNFAKSVFDAANGIWYADDKQIVELTASKEYGPVDQIVFKVYLAG